MTQHLIYSTKTAADLLGHVQLPDSCAKKVIPLLEDDLWGYDQDADVVYGVSNAFRGVQMAVWHALGSGQYIVFVYERDLQHKNTRELLKEMRGRRVVRVDLPVDPLRANQLIKRKRMR